MARFNGTFRAPAWYLLLGVGVFALVTFMISSGLSSTEGDFTGLPDDPSLYTAKQQDSTSSTATTEIEEGVIQGRTSIPLFRCSGNGELNIILLHGAHFSKKEWKNKGILGQLCHLPEVSSVVALDLANGSNHADLKAALIALQQSQIISSEKVVMVTPSASGHCMVDWAEKDMTGLKTHVKYWIPVAPPAVKSAEPKTLEGLRDIPILAVYGSRDGMGKEVSKRLEEYANAKVVEIEGGHPCYLDSPDAFVTVVSDFFKKSNSD